jgi:hypothetical protein
MAKRKRTKGQTTQKTKDRATRTSLKPEETFKLYEKLQNGEISIEDIINNHHMKDIETAIAL